MEINTQPLFLTLREFFSVILTLKCEIKQAFNRYVADTFRHTDKNALKKSICSDVFRQSVNIRSRRIGISSIKLQSAYI